MADKFRIVILIAFFMLSLCENSVGQRKISFGNLSFSNGLRIKIETVKTGLETVGSYGNIYSSQSNASIRPEILVHRVITDHKNKIYFGYDLQIEHLTDKSRKFTVTIKPLSKKPGEILFATNNGKVAPNYSDYDSRSLPNYPAPVTVDKGDSITIDILRNKKTNEKISDILTITHERNSPYNYDLEYVRLRLKKPKISINGKKYTPKKNVDGYVMMIYIHGKGAFLFTLAPQTKNPRFKKIGIINDKKLHFSYNGDKYEIESETSILDPYRRWNVWIANIQDFKPTQPVSKDDPFIYGPGPSPEFFLEKQ